MIRCVRLWAGKDGNSHVEEGMIDLAPSAMAGALAYFAIR
jgi:hypothetical protein